MTSLEELPEVIGWRALPAENRTILTRLYRDLIKKFRMGGKLTEEEQAYFELLSIFIGGPTDLSLETIERLLFIHFTEVSHGTAEDAENPMRLDDTVQAFRAEMGAMRRRYRAAYAYILNPSHAIQVAIPPLVDR